MVTTSTCLHQHEPHHAENSLMSLLIQIFIYLIEMFFLSTSLSNFVMLAHRHDHTTHLN